MDCRFAIVQLTLEASEQGLWPQDVTFVHPQTTVNKNFMFDEMNSLDK